MNDLAREALVRAALDGTPQIKGAYSDGKGGYCAMGVLMRTFQFSQDVATLGMCNKLDISESEAVDITRANDCGWDFLTIARKF